MSDDESTWSPTIPFNPEAKCQCREFPNDECRESLYDAPHDDGIVEDSSGSIPRSILAGIDEIYGILQQAAFFYCSVFIVKKPNKDILNFVFFCLCLKIMWILNEGEPRQSGTRTSSWSARI